MTLKSAQCSYSENIFHKSSCHSGQYQFKIYGGRVEFSVPKLHYAVIFFRNNKKCLLKGRLGSGVGDTVSITVINFAFHPGPLFPRFLEIIIIIISGNKV